MTTELNWAGNYRYSAAGVARTTSVEEVQGIVAGADRVRALGSRHSFNDSAHTAGTLVSPGDIPADLVIDEVASTATVGGGTRYGVLNTSCRASMPWPRSRRCVRGLRARRIS